MLNGILSDNRGYISFRVIFWVLFLGGVLYAGFKFGPPYVSYQLLKFEVQGEAENAHHYSDNELKARILKKAAHWRVPVEKEDVTIERRERDAEIEISVYYEMEINFLDRYQRRLYYYINVIRPLKVKV